MKLKQNQVNDELHKCQMYFWCLKKKNMKQDLPLLNSAGQGRKKATTPHDDRQLLRIMKKDPYYRLNGFHRMIKKGNFCLYCMSSFNRYEL